MEKEKALQFIAFYEMVRRYILDSSRGTGPLVGKPLAVEGAKSFLSENRPKYEELKEQFKYAV